MTGGEVPRFVEGVGRDYYREDADLIAVLLLHALKVLGERGAVWAGGLNESQHHGFAAIIGEIVPDALAIHQSEAGCATIGGGGHTRNKAQENGKQFSHFLSN